MVAPHTCLVYKINIISLLYLPVSIMVIQPHKDHNIREINEEEKEVQSWKEVQRTESLLPQCYAIPTKYYLDTREFRDFNTS